MIDCVNLGSQHLAGEANKRGPCVRSEFFVVERKRPAWVDRLEAPGWPHKTAPMVQCPSQ